MFSCNIPKDRESTAEQNELFIILHIIYLMGLYSPTWVKNDIYHDRFLVVYLLPCFEIKRPQAEFVICYVTFNSLQNGKKRLKKNDTFGVKSGLHCQ